MRTVIGGVPVGYSNQPFERSESVASNAPDEGEVVQVVPAVVDIGGQVLQEALEVLFVDPPRDFAHEAIMPEQSDSVPRDWRGCRHRLDEPVSGKGAVDAAGGVSLEAAHAVADEGVT